MNLTGKYYFKQSFWGLILMVEYKVENEENDFPEYFFYWRKARPQDLVYLKLSL